MNIIIVGCGRVGSILAEQFSETGHQVVVIDQNKSAFDSLSLDFQGRTIEGDVLVQNVLHRAEIEHADALLAVTRSDSLNALIAHVAKTEYQVPKVLARNIEPRQRALQEAFDVLVVGSNSWGAGRIEGLLSDSPLRAVFSDNNARFVLYQLKVPENWHGRSLQELLSEDHSKVLGITRAGEPLEVSHTQVLSTGDFIYVSADSKEIEALRRRLDQHKERPT